MGLGAATRAHGAPSRGGDSARSRSRRRVVGAELNARAGARACRLRSCDARVVEVAPATAGRGPLDVRALSRAALARSTQPVRSDGRLHRGSESARAHLGTTTARDARLADRRRALRGIAARLARLIARSDGTASRTAIERVAPWESRARRLQNAADQAPIKPRRVLPPDDPSSRPSRRHLLPPPRPHGAGVDRRPRRDHRRRLLAGRRVQRRLQHAGVGVQGREPADRGPLRRLLRAGDLRRLEGPGGRPERRRRSSASTPSSPRPSRSITSPSRRTSGSRRTARSARRRSR